MGSLGRDKRTECDFKIDNVLNNEEADVDKELLSYVKEVKAVVDRLLEIDDVLFVVKNCKGVLKLIVSNSLTGKKFKSLITKGYNNGFNNIPLVNSHPYVRAYHTAIENLNLNELDKWDPNDQMVRLNAAVTMIRDECSSKSMRQHMRKLDNAKRVRSKGAKKLIESLKNKHARLEVVRLDLSYREGKYIDLEEFTVALEDVKKDWEKFRYDLASEVSLPSAVGYLAKLEYGLLSGFHFHVIVIYDGSKHREDITLAKMLGEHWINQVVTGGEGRYYNCNRHKKNYRYLGIGTLDYYDHAKYSALVNLVLEYMVKTDYVLASEAPGERIWFRSADKIPKSLKRLGRPRKLNRQPC